MARVDSSAVMRTWLGRILHRQSTAWVFLVVSIGLTGLAWYIADRAQAKLTKERFLFRSDEVRSAIVQRMNQYELLLRGAVALFEASNQVTREEWKTYVQALDFQRDYPGIQGIGFSARIPRADKAAHEQDVRASGFADYAVTPGGERDEYYAIVYLEPFDARNRRAFGFDMHSEPTRRAAMDEARDTGRTTVSGIVTLKQETERDVQRGFLMYLPVYKHGAPHGTTLERRNALQGFVYAPFRGRDLMGGIFGGKFADLDYWVFDGASAGPDSLLFQNHPRAVMPATSELAETSPIHVARHMWTIHYRSDPERFEQSRAQPLGIACGGLVIDLLLFTIIASLGRTQARATALANDMTIELRRSLNEKEVLLQEVHHRVKNNLQVISSLINLQLRRLDSGSARDALEDCQRRLLAIALTHEKLCEVAGSGGVHFDDYVRDLTTSIASAMDTEAGRIRLDFDVSPVILSVEQAVPCGFILQELLSNAYKHAFASQAAGTLSVGLTATNGVVTLSVRDDGSGFPANFDAESATTLGLRLIRMFSEQLDAEIRTSSEHGAGTAVCFVQRPATNVHAGATFS